MDWGFAIVKIFITFLIEFLKNRKSTSLKTTLVIPIKIQNNIFWQYCVWYLKWLIKIIGGYLNCCPQMKYINGFVINLLGTLKLKHSWCINNIYWIKLDLQRLPINKKQEAIK